MSLGYFFDYLTVDAVIEAIADGSFFGDFSWVEESLFLTIDEYGVLTGIERDAIGLIADTEMIKSFVYEGMKKWVERNPQLAWYN